MLTLFYNYSGWTLIHTENSQMWLLNLLRVDQQASWLHIPGCQCPAPLCPKLRLLDFGVFDILHFQNLQMQKRTPPSPTGGLKSCHSAIRSICFSFGFGLGIPQLSVCLPLVVEHRNAYGFVRTSLAVICVLGFSKGGRLCLFCCPDTGQSAMC